MPSVAAEDMSSALGAADHGRSGLLIEEPFLRRRIPRIVQRFVNRPPLGTAFLDVPRASDILTPRSLKGFGQSAEDRGNLLHLFTHRVCVAVRPRAVRSVLDRFDRPGGDLSRAVYARLQVGSQVIGKITAWDVYNYV
jgi:hypothetical protein